MAEHIDKEIEAIKVVLHALEPLPAEVRANGIGRQNNCAYIARATL